MVSKYARLSVAGVAALSVTVRVKLAPPAAAGVPLMEPVEGFSVSPAGRVPAVMLQAYGAVPPDAVNACA